MNGNTAKLGFWGLTGIVFGSVIGGSIFNIAQNMAHNAALGAVLSAWLITGVGVLALVLTFKRLSDRCPQLSAGIYQYAQEGFGNYIGFNMAWGYWLCVILGNVAYAVMINDSLGSFFPVFNLHSWPTLIFGWSLIWVMYLIVSRGVKSAAFINTLLSVIKFLCLVLIIGILAVCIKVGMFSVDFWGNAVNSGLTSIDSQISSCMLVTIWSFLGIEGAVMMHARAKRNSDVGKATVTGFVLALILYILVSTLCFGVMTQPQIASLPTPSLAFALDYCAGPWAKWFVIISVLVSLTGGFLSWTLVCAQTPFEAAVVKIFPRQFLRLNKHNVPTYGMVVASIGICLCLMLVVTAENVYLASVNLTALMILPPYLLSGMYLLKRNRMAVQGKIPNPGHLIWFSIVAGVACIFCLYCIWAGSLELTMVTSLFYLAGTPFYIMARRQNTSEGITGKRVFTNAEGCLFFALCLAGIASIWLLANGSISLDI